MCMCEYDIDITAGILDTGINEINEVKLTGIWSLNRPNNITHFKEFPVMFCQSNNSCVYVCVCVYIYKINKIK